MKSSGHSEVISELSALLPLEDYPEYVFNSNCGHARLMLGIAALPSYRKKAIKIIGNRLDGVQEAELRDHPIANVNPLEALLAKNPFIESMSGNFLETLKKDGFEVALNLHGFLNPVHENLALGIFVRSRNFCKNYGIDGETKINNLYPRQSSAIHERLREMRLLLTHTQIDKTYFVIDEMWPEAEEIQAIKKEEDRRILCAIFRIAKIIDPTEKIFKENSFSSKELRTLSKNKKSPRQRGAEMHGEKEKLKKTPLGKRKFNVSLENDGEFVSSDFSLLLDSKNRYKIPDLRLQQRAYPSMRPLNQEPSAAENIQLMKRAAQLDCPEAILLATCETASCHCKDAHKLKIGKVESGYLAYSPTSTPNSPEGVNSELHRPVQENFERPVPTLVAEAFQSLTEESILKAQQHLDKWISSQQKGMTFAKHRDFLIYRGHEIFNYSHILTYHGFHRQEPKGESGWGYTHIDYRFWHLQENFFKFFYPDYRTPSIIPIGCNSAFCPRLDVVVALFAWLRRTIFSADLPSTPLELLQLHNATASAMSHLTQLLEGLRNNNFLVPKLWIFEDENGFDVDNQKEPHAWAPPLLLRKYVFQFVKFRERVFKKLGVKPSIELITSAFAPCHIQNQTLVPTDTMPSSLKKYLQQHPETSQWRNLESHCMRHLSNTELRISGVFTEIEVMAFHGHHFAAFGPFRRIRLECATQQHLRERACDELSRLLHLSL